MKTLKKILKNIWHKVESERHSKNPLYKILVAVKDILWKVCRFFWVSFYEIKRKLSKGKLPDFLIIGAAKAGTTSLWKNLKQHPDIEMSPNFIRILQIGNEIPWIKKKEISFFDKDEFWNKGKGWYISLFNKNKKIQGEASPGYIYSELCHQRMFETIPDAKLILILRDPVKRAYSQFNHMIDEKKIAWEGETLPTEDFTNFLKKVNEENYETSVIKTGFYIDQIENLLKYYPKKQLMIVISEKMQKNPQLVYDEIFEFLGVKKVKINYVSGVNKKEYKRPLEKENEKILQDIYRPYNERLFKFLGHKIEEWI